VNKAQFHLVIACSAVLFIAAEPAWKSKMPASWTGEDAAQILAGSPWAKTTESPIGPLQTEDQRRESGNMGLPRGIGYDGFADDRPRVQLPKNPVDIVKPEKPVFERRPVIRLDLRWESALPVRVAEMKTGFVSPPTLETDGYILAVYGVPDARVKGDPKHLGEPLRSLAVLKRDGKKDVKPSSVEVFQRDDGMVIVYVFPLSAEITKNDRYIQFAAQIGRISVAQVFDVAEMQFQGRLEL